MWAADGRRRKRRRPHASTHAVLDDVIRKFGAKGGRFSGQIKKEEEEDADDTGERHEVNGENDEVDEEVDE